MAVDPATLTAPGGPLANMTQAEQTEFLSAYFYGQNKGLSLGPWLMGFVIDLFFLGVVITQFFRWLSINHPERLFVRIIVYALIFFCVFYSVLATVYSMRLFVYGFGTYSTFGDMLWIEFFVLGDAIVASLAQVFYAERAWRLLGPQRAIMRIGFLVLLTLAMMLEVGGAFSSIIFVVTQIKTLFDAYKIEPVLYVWLGGQLSADTLITLTSSWILWQSKTGWSNTDKTIKRLVKITVETQLPPFLIAMAHMLYYSQNRQGTIIIAFGYAISKTYVIGLFAILNDRVKLRDDMNTFNTTNHNTYALKSSRHQQATVHVHTEVHTHSDSHPQRLHVGINRRISEEDLDVKEFQDENSLRDRNSDYKVNATDSRTFLTQ